MSKRLPKIFREGEPEALMNATTRERDRLILFVLFYCGLRAAELTALRVEHLDFRAGTLRVEGGKGDRDRSIPLAKHLIGPLRGWMGKRKTGYVFPSRQGGGRMTTRALQYLFKRMAIRAKLPDIGVAHPHSARHHFATSLLRSGVNIRVVQQLLGHASLSNTQKYTAVYDKDLFEAVNMI